MASVDCDETWRSGVLLFDCDSDSKLGISLRDTLGSVTPSEINLRYESFSRVEGKEEGAKILLERIKPDLVIVALRKPSLERVEPLFRQVIVRDPNLPIVVAIEEVEREDLIRLFEFDGIVDFIAAPFKALEIQVRIWRILERVRRKQKIVRQVTQKLQLKQLVGQSTAFTDSITDLADI